MDWIVGGHYPSLKGTIIDNPIVIKQSCRMVRDRSDTVVKTTKGRLWRSTSPSFHFLVEYQVLVFNVRDVEFFNAFSQNFYALTPIFSFGPRQGDLEAIGEVFQGHLLVPAIFIVSGLKEKKKTSPSCDLTLSIVDCMAYLFVEYLRTSRLGISQFSKHYFILNSQMLKHILTFYFFFSFL